VALGPGRRTVLRLHFGALPFTQGRFRVDISVTDVVGATLAERKGALDLAVLDDDQSTDGPARLGGFWEIPDGRSTPGEPSG
jgi:hypothetical protein